MNNGDWKKTIELERQDEARRGKAYNQNLL